MGVQNEIDRISGNVADTMSALSEYGVDTTGANSDDMAGLVRAIPKATIVQETGDSETAVMSQAAVTAALNQLGNEKVDYVTHLKPNRIINMAHRGAMPSEVPENTLPAYVRAGAMGFDYIEVDLRFTSDGVPVSLHDETINRTARNADGSAISGTISIADITYEQTLNYVFCGDLYDTYPDVTIPTVEEAVSLCKAMGVGVCFDLYPMLTTADIELIYAILDKYNMRDNVIMSSSTYANVLAVVNYYPKAVVATRTSTYGDPTTEGYDVVLPKVLNGLRSVSTGQNYVIGNVRTDYIAGYGPTLLENGFGIILSTIPVTDDDLLAASKLYTHILADDYVPTVRLQEITMKDEAPITLTRGEYDALLERITALEGGGEPVSILNLNRTQGTGWNNSSAETNYINPAQYQSTAISGTPCAIANLTENSITVTENGAGGRGVAFPLLVDASIFGVDRRGKSYLLTWDATGTTDTRFRLMFGNANGTKYVDLDNKNGTITSATIDISADGKTMTVNGKATTDTVSFVWMAFHFSAATGKTVSYTGVSLVEVTE